MNPTEHVVLEAVATALKAHTPAPFATGPLTVFVTQALQEEFPALTDEQIDRLTDLILRTTTTTALNRALRVIRDEDIPWHFRLLHILHSALATLGTAHSYNQTPGYRAGLSTAFESNPAITTEFCG